MNKQAGTGDNADLDCELQRLDAMLRESMAAPFEEAVPAEMMQVFTDEQWLQLRFEFQPSLRVFSSDRDIVDVRRQHEAGSNPAVPTQGAQRHWLIFRKQTEQLVRVMDDREYQALNIATGGGSFITLADALWPELEPELRQQEMTTLLLGWLAEGLIIDAGVPLPEDAEFVE